MSNQQNDIKRIFEELLEGNGDAGQRVRVRIDQGSPINLYAARTFPDRSVMLEIGPIQKAYLPSGFTQPRIKGLNITADAFQKEFGEVTLLLELQQTEALDVFTTFVARVCEQMNSLQKPADAVRAVIELIERWKDFFAGNSELLTEGRQTGLYGELYLIDRMYKANVSISKLVKAWTGSNHTNQDFQFGDLSIEVKSTAAVDATSVNITNIRQLDETGLELLLLNRVLLDARQGNEHTLPALIDYLRAVIAEHASEMSLDFEEKILRAKYRNKHAENYANRTYAERSLDFYEVKEGFPRLLENDLPTGVTKASYEITMERCKPFELPLEEVFAIVRKYCD